MFHPASAMWVSKEPSPASSLWTAAWDFTYAGDPSTVTVHIRRLREKIECPDTMKAIATSSTVLGRGLHETFDGGQGGAERTPAFLALQEPSFSSG